MFHVRRVLERHDNGLLFDRYPNRSAIWKHTCTLGQVLSFSVFHFQPCDDLSLNRDLGFNVAYGRRVLMPKKILDPV